MRVCCAGKGLGVKMDVGQQIFRSVEGFAEAAELLEVPWVIHSRENEFTASIRRQKCGGLLFGELHYDRCSGTRGDREIDRSIDDYVCITLYTGGSMVMKQRGTVLQAGPRDIILWDGNTPTEFDCLAPTQCEMVWLPRKMVRQRMGFENGFDGRLIPKTDAVAGLIGSHVMSLHRAIGKIPEYQVDDILNASIDLIFSCVNRDGDGGFASKSQFDMFSSVRNVIGERIGTDRFGPSDVAEELGISVSYLHRLFSIYGTTFSHYVNAERLDRARKMLSFRGKYRPKISDIAHDLGFCDSSHFNRLFSERYGVTPSQYWRNMHAQ